MRWRQGRRSENVEDRRGSRLPAGGFKIGGLGLLLVVVISIITGQNPLQLVSLLLEQQPGGVNVPATDQSQPQANDEQRDFMAAILADTEDTWNLIFQQMGSSYEPPKLVLFTEAVQSACGTTSSAVGPFYCPPDRRVYLDLGFFAELDQRFGAPGDFAQAYVVAHEVGHHVQNLLGISTKVHNLQQRKGEEEANLLSVKLELQADCLAGVWGYHANRQRQMLEPGDVEEGLGAAAAVGDDRLQRQSGQSASPESWTHGSSQMRVYWFNQGFQSGQFDSCDTFNAPIQ